MTIAIIGSGAVGCYFGAKLIQAGNDVVFLARGERLDKLQSEGITLQTEEQRETLPVRAVGRVSELPPVDFAFFCVKAWQLQPIAREMNEIGILPSCALTTQNGVEAAGEVAQCFGDEVVVASVIHGFFEMAGPSTVRHIGIEPKIIFGAPYSAKKSPSEELSRLLAGADIAHKQSDEIMVRLWEKLIMVSTIGAIGAMARQPVGRTRTDVTVRNYMRTLMAEIHSVGCAAGVQLPNDLIEQTFKFIDKFPADATTSMQRDIMAGNQSELECQLGVIIRLSDEMGISTPLAHFLYAFLKMQYTADGP